MYLGKLEYNFCQRIKIHKYGYCVFLRMFFRDSHWAGDDEYWSKRTFRLSLERQEDGAQAATLLLKLMVD